MQSLEWHWREVWQCNHNYKNWMQISKISVNGVRKGKRCTFICSCVVDCEFVCGHFLKTKIENRVLRAKEASGDTTILDNHIKTEAQKEKEVQKLWQASNKRMGKIQSEGQSIDNECQQLMKLLQEAQQKKENQRQLQEIQSVARNNRTQAQEIRNGLQKLKNEKQQLFLERAQIAKEFEKYKLQNDSLTALHVTETRKKRIESRFVNPLQIYAMQDE